MLTLILLSHYSPDRVGSILLASSVPFAADGRGGEDGTRPLSFLILKSKQGWQTFLPVPLPLAVVYVYREHFPPYVLQ